jgi:hypothetical protein
MGVPDGAHTHGSGGRGLGELLLIVLAVALLGPAVAAALVELIHVLLIVAAIMVGVGVLGLVGLLTWRWRRRSAVRIVVQRASVPVRAAEPLPPRLAMERRDQLHHFHRLDAETVAATIPQREAAPCRLRRIDPVTVVIVAVVAYFTFISPG